MHTSFLAHSFFKNLLYVLLLSKQRHHILWIFWVWSFEPIISCRRESVLSYIIRLDPSPLGYFEKFLEDMGLKLPAFRQYICKMCASLQLYSTFWIILQPMFHPFMSELKRKATLSSKELSTGWLHYTGRIIRLLLKNSHMLQNSIYASLCPRHLDYCQCNGNNT